MESAHHRGGSQPLHRTAGAPEPAGRRSSLYSRQAQAQARLRAIVRGLHHQPATRSGWPVVVYLLPPAPSHTHTGRARAVPSAALPPCNSPAECSCGCRSTARSKATTSARRQSCMVAAQRQALRPPPRSRRDGATASSSLTQRGTAGNREGEKRDRGSGRQVGCRRALVMVSEERTAGAWLLSGPGCGWSSCAQKQQVACCAPRRPLPLGPSAVARGWWWRGRWQGEEGAGWANPTFGGGTLEAANRWCGGPACMRGQPALR